jgi:hypothetical protein
MHLCGLLIAETAEIRAYQTLGEGIDLETVLARSSTMIGAA